MTSRGNARQAIYRDDLDREAQLGTIDRVVERYGWICHAYCLMGNHFHLLVETPKPNLSIGMRQLNGRYARGFNDRYDRVGHVFQARFSSVLVEKDGHLRDAARYIVLNPVAAGLCAHPADWPWSSYAATAGLEPRPSFLAIDELLAQFANMRHVAQRRYVDYVEAKLPEAHHAAPVVGQRLGPEAFLRDTFGYDPPLPEIPRVQIEPHPPSLVEIFNASATPVADAYRRHGYTLKQIGDFLGRHYSSVSRRLRDEETRHATMRLR